MNRAKEAIFLGDSLRRIREFPEPAKSLIGYELNEVQFGRVPNDFKPMSTIGNGVFEIRVSVQEGAFRAVYIAKFQEAVYVLHAFQKKTERTPQKDLLLAQKRLKQLLEDRT